MKTKYISILKKIVIFLLVTFKIFAQTNFCDQCVFTVSDLKTDAPGCKCYVDVTYNWNWSPGGNPSQFPYGIDAAVKSPGLITSIVQNVPFNSWPGWTVLPTTLPAQNSASNCCPSNLDTQVPFFPLKTYGWKSSTAIPAFAVLKFRIYLNFGTASQITLWLRVLNGGVNFPVNNNNKDCWYACQLVKNIDRITYTIAADQSQLCPNAIGTLHSVVRFLDPAPSLDCDIKWYRAPAPDLNNPPVTTNPLQAPWALMPQIGGLDLQDYSLTGSSWYIARISCGCSSLYSNPVLVTVCPMPNSIGNLVLDGTTNNVIHQCISWAGGLLSFTDPGVCNYNVKWSKSTDCGTTWTLAATTNTNKYNFTGPFPYSGTECNKCYMFKAEVSYTCNGALQNLPEKIFTCYVDKQTQPGIITAFPWDMCGSPCSFLTTYDNEHPVLCNPHGTVLNYSGGCGDVIKWESSTDDINWNEITWQGTTHYFNTGIINQTTLYRVTIKNGACSPDYKKIKVIVKPQLTVDISGCSMLCEGQNCNLTAITSYTSNGLNYMVHYKWFLNGSPTGCPDASTCTANQPGNYYVIVSDNVCNKEAKSNVINICSPSVEISGPTTFCPGQQFILKAFTNSCFPCAPGEISFNWTGPGGFTATSQSITRNVEGLYTVIAKCPNGCFTKATKNVVRCP
jgi:hypothetical protein